MTYEELALIMKAMSDPNRLKILEIISCGGKRACEILDFFDFTQPTLSHHMKTLTEARLVEKTLDGRWIYYTINQEIATQVMKQMTQLLSNDQADCLCQLMPKHNENKIKELI